MVINELNCLEVQNLVWVQQVGPHTELPAAVGIKKENKMWDEPLESAVGHHR